MKFKDLVDLKTLSVVCKDRNQQKVVYIKIKFNFKCLYDVVQ